MLEGRGAWPGGLCRSAPEGGHRTGREGCIVREESRCIPCLSLLAAPEDKIRRKEQKGSGLAFVGHRERPEAVCWFRFKDTVRHLRGKFIVLVPSPPLVA